MNTIKTKIHKSLTGPEETSSRGPIEVHHYEVKRSARARPLGRIIAVGLLPTCLLAFQSSAVVANGLAINEQSASSAGTAYAGRASSALDASTIYGNPAGLSKLKANEISSGVAIIDPSVDISHARGPATGTNKGDSVPLVAIPFGYFSTPLNDRFTFGLGVYSPFGLVNDYEHNFQGRYQGSTSISKVVTVQPTLAYKINDRLSVGLGVTVNRIDGELKSQLNTSALGGTDTKIKVTGDDTVLGYNAGVLFDLTEKTTLGLAYHSKVGFRLKGDMKISGSEGTLNADGKYDGHLALTMPESADASFTHHFNEEWTGYVGATWTRWSRLQTLGVVADSAPAGFSKLEEPENWHDTWSYALGASYQLTPRLQLRAGVSYDESPTDNAGRTVRIPVGNRKSATLGAGYAVSDSMTVDVAYGYVWESTASVNQANVSGLQPAYSAKYDNSGQGFATQLTYKF